MKTYIALLRGINVSGKNSIKMDALRRLFEDLNFQKVRTYLQSGNVVFLSEPADSIDLETRISAEIKKQFNFTVPVIILSSEELENYINSNPFIKNKDEKFLHFTFLGQRVGSYNLSAIDSKKAENEEFVIADRVIYLYCPNGYGITKLNNTFFENTLKISATTRNFKTTIALLKIATDEN